MNRREQEVIRKDEEERILEEVEEQLMEDVRRLWRATRWYAGHESWTFYIGFEEDTWCGCDCNHWNRIALKQAIKRLRAFRQGVYWA
jgi:hypothetical protein